MPTALLNDDVIRIICCHLDSQSLYRLCLVSRQWRDHAQVALYDSVSIGTSLKQPPTPHNGARLRQSTHLFSRTITTRHNLATALTFFAYHDTHFSKTQDMLRSILLAASKLETFKYIPIQGELVGADALKYKEIFQEASFKHFSIDTLSLHHICLIPPRPLESVEFRELAPDAVCEYPPVSSSLDLSGLRITARYFIIRGFQETQPMGIGTTMWTLSSFFENCVVGPQLFGLEATVIGRKTVQAPLLAFGSHLKHLIIAPGLPKPSPAGWSLLGPEDLLVLGGLDINWSCTTPNLKQLTTSVFFPSLHGLKTLHTLTIAWRTGTGDISLLVGLLEDGNFSPNLRYLVQSHKVYRCVLDNAGLVPFTVLFRYLLRLLAAREKRNLKVYPLDFADNAMDILSARQVLVQTSLTLAPYSEEVYDNDDE